MKEPYDWDAYAETFFPFAEKLAQTAEEAEKAGEKEKASEYYLYDQKRPHGERLTANTSSNANAFLSRASALYRISRFPAPRSEKQREAWKLGKAVCIKGLGSVFLPLP